MRKGHIHRGDTDCGNLGDGAGTGAADDQICIGEGLGCVVDEGSEFSLNARVLVVGAQGIDLTSAALVHHPRPLRRVDQGQRPGHDVIERLRA